MFLYKIKYSGSGKKSQGILFSDFSLLEFLHTKKPRTLRMRGIKYTLLFINPR